jgi:hypothetical protein
MDRAAVESRIGASSYDMRVVVADASDDADLRALLRCNPMGGLISLSLEREPKYFARRAGNEEHQAIIARDTGSWASIGMCARSVWPAYIDGVVRPLGYIGELRIAPEYRHRYRVIREGFAALRSELHEPSRTPFYLSAIVADNRVARRLLEANLPGKPHYLRVATYCTLALKTRRRRRRPINFGTAEDIPQIAACLARNHARYQFALHWSEADLVNASAVGGPNADDFVLVHSGTHVTGCIALWDQRHVQQVVVRGYRRPLQQLRPILNLIGRVGGLPHLPPPGQVLRQVFLGLAAIDNDNSEVLIDLVGDALSAAARRGFDIAVIGLAETNPMLPALRRAFRCREYKSQLYLVHWDDGRDHVHALEPRIPHVEASLL